MNQTVALNSRIAGLLSALGAFGIRTGLLAAAVPASAAVLAIPDLSEVPTVIEWFGIAVVTVGLVLLLIKPSDVKG